MGLTKAFWVRGNKSCVSLFNSINMKWVLNLSLLSTLSPEYFADLTFSKVPFIDDVRGRDKFLFVDDTNALTNQRMELHQSNLFPFLKGIDIDLKLDSVSGRCNLLVEYTIICKESSGKRYTSGPRYWYMSIGQYYTILAFQYCLLLDPTNMF